MVEKSCNTTTSNWGSSSRFFDCNFLLLRKLHASRYCAAAWYERDTLVPFVKFHTPLTLLPGIELAEMGDIPLQKLNLLHTLCSMWPSITILANLGSTREEWNIPNPTIGKISCFSFCHQRQCDPQICYLNIYNVYCNLQCNVQSETTACWWWRKEILPDLTRSSLLTKCSWLSCSPSSCWSSSCWCFK